MTVAKFYDERVREREEKLDVDDNYELPRLRAKDSYKDEHRRGEGNRHNRS